MTKIVIETFLQATLSEKLARKHSGSFSLNVSLSFFIRNLDVRITYFFLLLSFGFAVENEIVIEFERKRDEENKTFVCQKPQGGRNYGRRAILTLESSIYTRR